MNATQAQQSTYSMALIDTIDLVVAPMDSLGAKSVVRCPDASQVNATSSPELAVPEAFILHDGPLSVTLGPIGVGSGALA